MIDITELSVVKPHEVEPGTLLLAGADYSEPPTFIFAVGEQLFFYECRGARPFVGCRMADNLDPYISSGPATLLVDVDTMIRPRHADVALGSAVLIGDEPCVAIRINNAIAYVRTDGQIIDDPESYERVVAFPRWRFVVPALGDQGWKTVHENGNGHDRTRAETEIP